MSILTEYRKYENPPEKGTREEDKKLLVEITEAKCPLAKCLLNHLKPHIKWSKEDELVHDQSVFSDSNMAELLKDTVTDMKKEKPEPDKEFLEILRKADTPKHLICNMQVWTSLNPPPRLTARLGRKKKAWSHPKF